MLVLPIKKQWFEMIANGEKKEEYREIKPYWTKRFDKYFHNRRGLLVTKEIIFRNGYSYKSPSIKCLVWLTRGTGKKEWGANPNEKCYKLIILRVLEVRNYNV